MVQVRNVRLKVIKIWKYHNYSNYRGLEEPQHFKLILLLALTRAVSSTAPGIPRMTMMMMMMGWASSPKTGGDSTLHIHAHESAAAAQRGRRDDSIWAPENQHDIREPESRLDRISVCK